MCKPFLSRMREKVIFLCKTSVRSVRCATVSADVSISEKELQN